MKEGHLRPSSEGLGLVYSRARMPPHRSLARALALMALAALPLSLGACGGATQNVRAFRAYANEDPSIKVSIDRVEDIAVTLQLVDRILTGTSYTPNDLWVKRLPLSNSDAKRIKEDLHEKYPYNGSGEHEVPVLKIYRDHIQDTFRDYGPPPEKGKYPSLLDAVAGLNPRTAQVKAHWVTYRDATQKLADAHENEQRISSELLGLNANDQKRRQPELDRARANVAAQTAAVSAAKEHVRLDAEILASDQELTKGDKQQIARDGFFALSVCFRIELEALALMPIIAIQTIRALPTAPADLTNKPNLKIGRQVYQLPQYIAGIKESMNRQAEVLESMTGALAKALKTSVDDSPGFELTESVVDQIVGITLDSFRVDVHAGADAFVYSSIGTSDRSGDSKTSYDYRGRQFKLDYRIDPIVLASARMDVVLDWIRMPGVANLGFGYSTDRVWSSGGKVESSSLTDALGIKGVASDVIDAGIGLLGIRSSVKIASFTSGTLRQVQATNVDNVVATAPLQLKYTQIDVGYDILWALNDDNLRSFMEELVVGARYIDYKLPRIVYELKDTSAVAGEQHFTFNRESPPQVVDSKYYMAAVSARFGVGESPRWSPFLDVGLAGGGGPVAFYFLQPGITPSSPDAALDQNHDHVRELSWVFNGSLAGGIRWRLLPRGWRLRLDLRASYRADVIVTGVHREAAPNGAALRTDFGSFDVFHTPSIAFRGSF
jgi:hypothetical protein